jgi:hypothetical protein
MPQDVAPGAARGIIQADLALLRSVRVSALALALAPLVALFDCGGSPFSAGASVDASTGSADGSTRSGDASGSSGGDASDAPACTPDTDSQRCNDCLATHCDGEWCACTQYQACEVYIGCVLRGGSVTNCASACGCSTDARSAGDKLITCSTAHCSAECASGSSSGSSSGGSSSGSSSGSSGSSSGGSSGSSSGSSSSSGASGSSSGAHSDGGYLCACTGCIAPEVCCSVTSSATDCGKCYAPTCTSCCPP